MGLVEKLDEKHPKTWDEKHPERELALDIQIPPEVWCFRYVFGVKIPSQEVFGCQKLAVS